MTMNHVELSNAGLVKWYNSSFPNCGQESDSPTPHMLRGVSQFLTFLGVASLAVLAVSVISDLQPTQEVAYVHPERVQSVAEAPTSTPETEVTASSLTPTKEEIAAQPAAAAQSQHTPTGNEVYRIRNPYSFAVKTDAELYAVARAAIVNIYCESRGRVNSISGSGVIIDPRGVILTNAHVAQYLLLASDSALKITCSIRTGSPSENRYTAEILYLSPSWIEEHAKDIAAKRPTGTGEHDYAILHISGTVDGTPLPASFPYLPRDIREVIAFTGDRVLMAGYPAEFAIRSTAGATLYPTSVFTRIGELLTFGERSVDLISLGGAVLAQSGSSGGAVVNMWGQLVGVISTTSEGATTAERELRAITLAYINRDLQTETGFDLNSLLTGDLAARASLFMSTEAPILRETLISHLP